jgi:preprotein translocase subunit SecE
MADRIKLVIALLVLAGGLVAFYIFADQSLLYRVLGLVAVAAVSIAITMTTELGRNSWGFLKDARTEVRKVVWPTRQETSQTTLLILAAVVVVGIFLWLLDMGLLALVQMMTGQGS